MIKLLRLKFVPASEESIGSPLEQQYGVHISLNGQVYIEGRESDGPLNLEAIVAAQRENADLVESKFNALMSAWQENLEWRKMQWP